MEENFTKNELIKTYQFTEADFEQFAAKGIAPASIKNQLDILKNEILKTFLDRPAAINDGIIKYYETDFKNLASSFEIEKEKFKLQKFVPASGAATRMFKFLSEFLNEFDVENESINAYINRKKEKNLSIFIVGLDKFPFFEAVETKLKSTYLDYNSWDKDKQNYHFIKTLLSPESFDYANKPKGSLLFHQYKDHLATPIEEHLNECAFYASSKNVSHLHFTVSENHQLLFEKIISEVKQKVEDKSKTKLNVNFSYQNKATDSIALDSNNNPIRDENGRLVFRPGGHGALIENLNNLDADIVFIKNIDNVIQNHIHSITLYKKALAGILIEIQKQVFNYLNEIEQNTDTNLEPIIEFVKHKLNVAIIDDFDKYTLENKIGFLKSSLNRPIRVCGMVKNEGEPGGGPFWVSDFRGNVSLQIVETSQIDQQNPFQFSRLKSATHFNPVDLVCGIKNYKGEKFDLTRFVDHKSGFVVEKNKSGKIVKSYELPGLWNGAMANWITIFVEVPLITFNPVKTVNDLLKPTHQPQ
ncbi:MAG: DUF4301 family protein [Bacteroidota bacterium]